MNWFNWEYIDLLGDKQMMINKNDIHVDELYDADAEDDECVSSLLQVVVHVVQVHPVLKLVTRRKTL